MNCIYLMKRWNGELKCKRDGSIIKLSQCFNCPHKEYKLYERILGRRNKPSKRTKELAISKNTKLIVYQRDGGKCIFCDAPVTWNLANSHFIKRSHGGLGIEQNIFCACAECHHEFDDTINRNQMLPIARKHLQSKYMDWNEEDLVYKKGS